MNKNVYSEQHHHPSHPTVVEMVAYRREGQTYDVYVEEPVGSVPELEGNRVDDNHILIKKAVKLAALDQVFLSVDKMLGDNYQKAVFYTEQGGRGIIDPIVQMLHKENIRGIWVRQNQNQEWELWIRKKDFAFAQGILEMILGKKTK
jgi:hypothetical protein